MNNNTVQTLVDYIKDLTGLTNASDAKVIRAINFAIDHYSYLALTSSGHWKWDSRLNNDISRVTGTLTTSGKITLEEEAATLEHLEILINGKYKTLKPRDQRDSDTPFDSLYNGTGKPEVYDVEGRFVRVFPTPDQSYTVRLSYGRAHPRFTTADLASAVGIEPMHEEYIALYAADRLMIGSNDPSRTQIRNEMQVKQEEIRDLFSKRDQDTPRRLKAKVAAPFRTSGRKS